MNESHTNGQVFSEPTNLASENISHQVLPGATVTVTGANGKAGRAIVADLLAHGYRVRATDVVGHPNSLRDIGVDAALMLADLTDFGQASETLVGSHAVIHMGNIPAPGLATDAETLNRNNAANSNIFLAAQRLGLRRVVWASSETTLGLPFDVDPEYAPINEVHYPYPTTTYALSKVVGETMAEHFAQWSGTPHIGLRFTNIFSNLFGLNDYAAVPGFHGDLALRRWNLWGYIDVRDAASAARAALTAAITGSVNLIIAADDTIVDTDSERAMQAEFPAVHLTQPVRGHETLLSNALAKRVLGWQPQHSWRDNI